MVRNEGFDSTQVKAVIPEEVTQMKVGGWGYFFVGLHFGSKNTR